MIPMRLELQAFGPYMEREEIDFTKIFDNKLFLITGNTGSGKTMIFDAICYALFGEASGQDRKVDTFKSHFSDKSLISYVKFKFLHRGKEYEILREPDQIKISRGKEVSHRPSAKIIFDDEVITGVKNVNQKIVDILGINYSQFKQIVMIAQGEFRKLVSADSKEREVIYRKIFNTSDFERIQRLLKEQANSFGRTIDSLNDKMEGILDSIKHLKEISLKDEKYEDITEILNQEIKIHQIRGGELSSEKKKLTDKIHEQSILINKFEELLSFEEKMREINVLKNKREKEFLENAEKTFLIREKENNLNNSLEQEKICNKEINNLNSSIESHYENLKNIKKDLENENLIMDEIEKFKRDIIELENLEKEFDLKIELILKIEIDKKNLKILKSKKSDLESRKNSIENHKNQILKFQEDNFNILNEISDLNGEIRKFNLFKESLKIYSDELEIYKSDLSNYENINPIYNKAFEDYNKKLIELSNIEEFYSRNQAGILAKKLVEGEPCMVCGSKIHPTKAILMSEDFDEESLKKVRKEFKDIEKYKNEVNEKATKLNASINSRKESLKKYYDNLVLRDEDLKILNFGEFEIDKNIFTKINSFLLDMNQKLKHKNDLNKKISDSKEELIKIEDEFKNINSNIVKCDLEIGKITSNLNHNNEILIDKDSKLSKYNVNTKEQYLNKVSSLKNQCKLKIDNLKELKDKFQQINEKYLKLKTQIDVKNSDLIKFQNKVKESQNEFLKILNEKGFKNESDYNRFKLSEEEYKIRNENLKNEREKYLYLNSNIKNLKDSYPIFQNSNIHELKNDKNNLQKKLDDLEKNEKLIHSTISSLKNANKNISDIILKISHSDKRRTNLNELSSFANGSNKFKISFERYILGIYFSEIINAANIRFSKLTNGRYLFRHLKDNLLDMRSQQGLDISVFDNYTSQERKINTLSGGESFKASLSLALGLSDVVQRYSGGISIDTLFIDEGFGSLDSDSLQNALECLLDANDKSKLIGIISHVQELKDFIKSKIEVISSNNGSKIKK